MLSRSEFGDRSDRASVLGGILAKQLWALPGLRDRVLVAPFGYETHMPVNVLQKLRFVRSHTARFVRHTPDAFVLDVTDPNGCYLLEYKVTQTPLYSATRIAEIGRRSQQPQLDWPDIGQMEADAYDNYRSLADAGVRVVILSYCAYHPRLLLADDVSNIQVLYRDVVTTDTRTGSRTPFVNYSCLSMKGLDDFLRHEHSVEVRPDQYSSLCESVARALPITHHGYSPLFERK